MTKKAKAQTGTVAQKEAPPIVNALARLDVGNASDAPGGGSPAPDFNAAKAAASVRGQKRVPIIIHNGHGEVGKQAVYVNLNGWEANIPREKVEKVPLSVIKMLRDTCEQEFGQNGEKLGMVPRYNIEVLGGAE